MSVFQIFPKKSLCDVCLLKVAKTTWDRGDVIQTLSQVGRGFAAQLPESVIPLHILSAIQRIIMDPEALVLIRTVS